VRVSAVTPEGTKPDGNLIVEAEPTVTPLEVDVDVEAEKSNVR
jgi:hypothetical protein